MLGMDATAREPSARTRCSGGLIGAALGLLMLASSLLGADGRGVVAGALWDPQRYIKVDEVEPGMEAYCLTDYGEAGIEKFALKVVDVVRDMEPGRDAILVMGLDDRFKHTGVVGGCSGSPVYIDGRLAGALAFGWTFAKDALYGVTPIEEMLQVGAGAGAKSSARPPAHAAFKFDLSKPVDLAEIGRQVATMRPFGPRHTRGATALPCPLLISGLPTGTCERLASELDALGFAAMPGLSGAPEAGADTTTSLKPGGVLTIPVVTGDIKMNVLGTVTEVRGRQVYGFGHSFLGYGATDLPLAGGQIYTVVSSMMRSFKLGTASEIVGAIRFDESAAVRGEIGAKPKMIPVSVRVERYNDPSSRTYNCQVADNKLLTASLVRATLSGAATYAGTFPPDHTVQYQVAIHLGDGQSIRFENISTSLGLVEPAAEISGALALLMNNPYRAADITSLDMAIRISAKDLSAYLWSVDVADPRVKPGEELDVEIIVESFLMEKKKYHVSLTVPKDVPPGKYALMLLGIYEYENFLRKSRPYRFIATNYETIVEALNEALNYDRTQLYCLLTLPADGIALDRAELPDLPGTKTLILQSDKRAIRVQPYPQWVEKTIETGTVIADKEMVPIIVEK